jgi:small redox-active disulfide protein 2
MKIEIFGTGCAKCDSLARTAQAAADRLGLEYEMVKVTDIARFAERGVIVTPALAIDGKLRLSGKVPSESAMASLLTTAAAERRDA